MSNSPYDEPSFDEGHVLEWMRGRRYHHHDPAAAQARDPAQGHTMIAEAAYYRAEKRHFEPGHELDDWLQAEAEVASLLH